MGVEMIELRTLMLLVHYGALAWVFILIRKLTKKINELNAVTSGYISVDFGDTEDKQGTWTIEQCQGK